MYNLIINQIIKFLFFNKKNELKNKNPFFLSFFTFTSFQVDFDSRLSYHAFFFPMRIFKFIFRRLDVRDYRNRR